MKREIINFNQEWLYKNEDIENGYFKDFDDSGFEKCASCKYNP